MTKARALQSIAVVTFLWFMYGAVSTLLHLPLLRLLPYPGGIHVLSLMVVLFTVSHAVMALGWRHAVAFLAVTVVFPWYLENAGVASGRIYGGYHYTDVLGPRIGHVPIVIPFSWFEYLYCSYIVANCLVGEGPVGTQGRWMRIALISLLTAALTTAQDLIIDPVMAGPVVRAWVWESPGGIYLGIPATNYVGWLLTALLAILPYRLLESRLPPQPVAPLTRLTTTLPLLVFGINILIGMSWIAPRALTVIGPFALGTPLLIALMRVWLPSPRQDLFLNR